MPLFLRKIRKAKWYKINGAAWLPASEFQADALSDLGTKDNTLSVWYINDDKSNLEQVVAALATTSEHISNLDYALFDQQVLREIDIRVSQDRGATLDENVNATWHRNLIELSGNKIVELAKRILVSAEKSRIPQTRVLALVRQAVTAGRIQRSELKSDVRAKIT